MSAKNAPPRGRHRPGEDRRYLDAVEQFLENVLRCGRGRRTPLFADGIDVVRKCPTVAPNGQAISDFAFQQNLLRGLVAASVVTGKAKYRRAAEAATAYALEHLVDPVSGLGWWGAHAYYDLKSGSLDSGPAAMHELKYDYPFYDLWYEVNPQATARFIESFWSAHVDLESEWLLFGRPGYLGVAGPRGRVHPGELAFILTAADLFYAAGFLYSKSGESLWRQRALALAERCARLRDPNTGLGPEILDVFDPSFDRQTFRLSLGHLGVTAANLLEHVRSALYALAQLHLAEILPEDASGPFRQWAVEDLEAYARHGYDEAEDGFFAMRRTDTGERIRLGETRWLPMDPNGHYYLPIKFRKNQGLPAIFYAYARGYRQTGNPLLEETARKCLLGLQIADCGLQIAGTPGAPTHGLSAADGAPGGPALTAGEFAKSDFAAMLIQGLLDLYERDAKPADLDAARRVADDSLALFYRDGFFADWPGGFRHSRTNQGLPLALLRLADALNHLTPANAAGQPKAHTAARKSRIENLESEIPRDVGGYGMYGEFNPVISYLDTDDTTTGYMWCRHFYDLRGPEIAARIGDGTPHDGGLTGAAAPGLWRLSGRTHPENVLDEQAGMALSFLPANLPSWSFCMPDGDEVRVEHLSFGPHTATREGHHLRVEMDYGLAAPCWLDVTTTVWALEEDYGPLCLRAVLALCPEAHPETAVFHDGAFRTVASAPSEQLVPKERPNLPRTIEHCYSLPLSYTVVGNVALALMLDTTAPADLVIAGARDGAPERRGVAWYIEDARKGIAHTFRIRVGVVPLERLGSLERAFEAFRSEA